jgi:hypothetical protein
MKRHLTRRRIFACQFPPEGFKRNILTKNIMWPFNNKKKVETVGEKIRREAKERTDKLRISISSGSSHRSQASNPDPLLDPMNPISPLSPFSIWSHQNNNDHHEDKQESSPSHHHDSDSHRNYDSSPSWDSGSSHHSSDSSSHDSGSSYDSSSSSYDSSSSSSD